MSDHPTLVARLAATYLPPRSQDGVGATTAAPENYANRQSVNAAAESYFEDDLQLHGDTLPSTTILKERPIHRLMIYLHASGASASDIAKQTGYTPTSIRTVLAQPWARQRLVQILNETGRDQVKHFLTHEVAPSLEVLRTVRDDPKSKNAEKISAVNSILDRALGKPTVHVETESTVTKPGDLDRIDAEIEAVRKQLADKGADSTVSSRN